MLHTCPYCHTTLANTARRIAHLADPNGCPARRRRESVAAPTKIGRALTPDPA